MTENRILRHQLKGRMQLSDGERKTLAEIGYKLGKHALADVATIVKPDTILGWHRKLVSQKFDGSAQRKAPWRPLIDPELEALVVRMAQENCSWGYDRIVGALANLDYTVSDQTVGNILKRHGIPPAPERKFTTTWKEFKCRQPPACTLLTLCQKSKRRNSMTYKGIVKGKTIEFADPLALPEGTEVDVEVHVHPKHACAASRAPQGSGQALLDLWETPAQCTPEDVDLLLQAIDQGKRPVRFAGIFDQEEPPR